MVTDRVGDFIIRLQNAVMVGKREVRAPYSGHIIAIAKKLKELGFVERVEIRGEEDAGREIIATLAYDERGAAKLRGVKRVSSPGRRLYTSAGQAHRVKGGTGARLISTSSGVLSDTEARQRHVGGEDLFEIW